MRTLLMKMLRCVFGLMIFAFGTYLCIRANIGLAPWPALSTGISGATGLSFGDVTVMTSIVILVIDLLLGETIGFGTLLDAVLVGKLVDLYTYFDLVPMIEVFWVGTLVLVAGQVFLSVGSYFYMGAGLGCGPRDALMVAIGKRAPNMPIGVARALIEGCALLVGWLLGAKVGLGTVISVFAIGFVLELTFKLLRFDVKSVHQQSVAQSVKSVARAA